KARLTTPHVPVRAHKLRPQAAELGKRVRDFSLAVQGMLMRHREEILFRQYVQERLAEAACEPDAPACTLSRLDRLLTLGNGNAAEVQRDATVGRYYLRISDRRIRQCLAALKDNDDRFTTEAADAVLGKLG